MTLFVVFAAYVRFAPAKSDEWHVDPDAVRKTSKPNQYLLSAAADANGGAVAFSMPSAKLADRLDAVALASGASVMAGSAETGHVTYVLRTKLMAYPDYVSARIKDAGDGVELSIYSRSRFGRSDLGVNKKRIKSWLKKIEAAN